MIDFNKIHFHSGATESTTVSGPVGEKRTVVNLSQFLLYSVLIAFFLLSVCENDYVSYSATGGCYKYFPLLMTWERARSYCQDNVPYNVGDLASIPDAGTNTFLQNLIQDAYIWVGGLRNDSTNSTSTWTWSDGTPWDDQNTFFFDGQPNNAGKA